MKWHDDLGKDERSELSKLADQLNLPHPTQYESHSVFLFAIRGRIFEASGLLSQAVNLLHGGK